MPDSSSSDPVRRAEELSDKMLDRSLTDAEYAELMRLVEQDPASSMRLREAVCLHALLREEAHGGQSDPLSAQLFGVRPEELTELSSRLRSAGWEGTAKPEPARPIESRTGAGRFWAGRPALAIAATLSVLVVCYEAWIRPQAAKLFRNRSIAMEVKAGPQEDSAAMAVAQLTYTSGCTWGGIGGPAPALNSQVRLGDEVVLHEGIAEFRLSSGVSISIEGPAALVLTSPTSLMLQHGRMTVFVSPDVPSFRLMAAGCRITGAGAEFGVHVAGGNVEVHAFSGEILAAPALAQEQSAAPVGLIALVREDDVGSSSSFPPTKVVAGQCLAIASADDDTIVSRWQAADETQFATKLSMAGRLPISKAYVSAIKKSRPLGYWRFEKDRDGLVGNEIVGLAGLQIVGDVNFVGDKSNYSLELGRPGSYGILVCKNELNLPLGSDYSVEIWMKPSHYHVGGLVGMIIPQENDIRELGAFCLLTTRIGGNRQCLRYMHRDPPSFDFKSGTDCYSNIPYRLRRWQHLAAVKRGPEMELYLDGNLVGSERDEGSLVQHLCVFVGAVSANREASPFIGQLDELAIYPRALGLDEINQHIDAVNWNSERKDDVQVNGI